MIGGVLAERTKGEVGSACSKAAELARSNALSSSMEVNMSEYRVNVEWTRGDAIFTDRRYSRAHAWVFDGGLVVPASSSPSVVPVPYSKPENIDPEEAYVASLSSCHMLWFLDFAARRGFVVECYRDEAKAVMEPNSDQKMMITHVTLCPHVFFSGQVLPNESDVTSLHHMAHESCFIANSVKTVVETTGAWSVQHNSQSL